MQYITFAYQQLTAYPTGFKRTKTTFTTILKQVSGFYYSFLLKKLHEKLKNACTCRTKTSSHPH